MPRLQPPKGYTTAKYAKQTLHISDAALRQHTFRGEIGYLVPKGRKQGFYLKRDIDRIANELKAYYALKDDEEKENITTELVPATKEDLKEISKIGNKLFGANTTITTTIPYWRYILLKKNKESQYALKHGDKIIGFATVIPFKTNTNKIEILLRSETISEAQITEDDIETLEPGKHIHLYIGAIGIEPDIEKYKKRYYGAALVSRLIDKIINLGERGIIIEDITALGATKKGIRLLQIFGLHEIPPRKENNRAFTMHIDDSGSPLSLQYKKVLETIKINTLKTDKEST